MDAFKLAKTMGVAEKDVDNLMRMITDSMIKDGMTDAFLSMSAEDRVDAVEAYMQAEIKKFYEFCTTLLTNPEKKSAFDSYLYSQLKD